MIAFKKVVEIKSTVLENAFNHYDMHVQYNGNILWQNLNYYI